MKKVLKEMSVADKTISIGNKNNRYIITLIIIINYKYQ